MQVCHLQMLLVYLTNGSLHQVQTMQLISEKNGPPDQEEPAGVKTELASAPGPDHAVNGPVLQ